MKAGGRKRESFGSNFETVSRPDHFSVITAPKNAFSGLIYDSLWSKKAVEAKGDPEEVVRKRSLRLSFIEFSIKLVNATKKNFLALSFDNVHETDVYAFMDAGGASDFPPPQLPKHLS